MIIDGPFNKEETREEILEKAFIEYKKSYKSAKPLIVDQNLERQKDVKSQTVSMKWLIFKNHVKGAWLSFRQIFSNIWFVIFSRKIKSKIIVGDSYFTSNSGLILEHHFPFLKGKVKSDLKYIHEKPIEVLQEQMKNTKSVRPERKEPFFEEAKRELEAKHNVFITNPNRE